MPGIITSRTTRSGRRSRAKRQASSPSAASSTSIVGSSSATSTTGGAASRLTVPCSKNLPALVKFRHASFVNELRWNTRGRLDELLVGGDELHHCRHVALCELQLVLHHPLGRIELLPNHFLP